MTNNERIAEFYDPERKRAGWWKKQYSCPHCGDTHDRPNYYVPHPAESGEWARYNCRKCQRNVLPELPISEKLPDGYGWKIAFVPNRLPAFDTDDLAAFQNLRGPLLAMGCVTISEQKEGAWVEYADEPSEAEPWLTYHHIAPADDDGAPLPYAAALSAAFLWAMDNQPEALRRACEVAG